MPNTNTVERRLEAGGIITITYNAVAYVFMTLRPGTLRWKNGLREVILDHDRDSLIQGELGQERPSEIEFDGRFTGVDTAAMDLFAILRQELTNSNKVREFTVEIKFPDHRSAIVGDMITFTKCFLAEGIQYAAGDGGNYDVTNFKFMSRDIRGTEGTY